VGIDAHRVAFSEMEVAVRLAWWLTISLALAIALTGAVPARAGDAEPVRRARDITVEGRVLEPAEIFEDTATETEILTREHVQSLPANDAAEVVRRLPGIRTQRRVQGQEAAVSIEGLPPNYTQVLVNGQRYTGEVGGVQDLRDLPIGDVERIEILRGAQALRHGSEASGGVVNLVTREAPREGYRSGLQLSGGDDDRLLGHAGFGIGRGPVRGTFAFDHDQIDGFDPPANLEGGVLTGGNGDSRRMSEDVYTTLDWDATDALTLRTELGWRVENEDIAFEEDDGSTSRLPRDFERWTVTQEADWLASETLRVVGSLHWYNGLTETDVGREFAIDEHELRVELAGEWFGATGPVTHALTAGVDARFDWLGLDEGDFSADITNPSLQPQDRDESLQRAGLFLIGESELASWAALEWGVRAQLHSEFDTEAVPQVGLLLRPMDGLKVRFSYGRAYFTPSLRDLHQPAVPNQGGAYFLEGNPDLVPENSESWRVGFEYTPRRWISVAATGFWNDLDDHIRSTNAGVLTRGFETELVETPPDVFSRPGFELICEVAPTLPECLALAAGVSEIEVERALTSSLFRKANLDRVRTRGVEARLELRPHPRFDLSVGYTWLDTFVEDPDLPALDELPNEPHHTVDVLTRVTIPKIETRVALQARWRGRALVENSGTGLLGFTSGERSDPSLFVDLRLSRKIGDFMEVYTDLRNLGDERVEDSYVVRGRTWLLGFRMNFSGRRLE